MLNKAENKQALPEGWREVELGTIMSVRKEKFNPAIESKDAPCIDLAHIEKGTGRIISSSYSSDKQSIKSVFYSGDVLYGKLRPNLRKFAYPSFNGVCTSEIWVFSVNIKICIPKFVFYLVQSNDFTRIACRTTGTKMPRADWSLLKKYRTTIPSFEEQKTIASLLGKWDTAIEKTEALIAAKEKQFQWLLKTLISDQQGNPEWREVRLGEVASVKTGPFGAQLHQNDYVKSNGTPIVTVEHLHEFGVAHKNLPLVSDYDKKRLKQFIVSKGDILFSRVGSVDRCSLVSKKEDGWLFSGRLLRIKPQETVVHSPYLVYFFRTKKFKHHARSVAVGGTMPSLNTSILSGVSVRFPPIPEQKAIASLLEKWGIAIEKTEALVEQYRTQKHGLMQKLLTGKYRTL